MTFLQWKKVAEPSILRVLPPLCVDPPHLGRVKFHGYFSVMNSGSWELENTVYEVTFLVTRFFPHFSERRGEQCE